MKYTSNGIKPSSPHLDRLILEKMSIDELKESIIEMEAELQRRNADLADDGHSHWTKSFKIGDHKIEVKPPMGGES